LAGLHGFVELLSGGGLSVDGVRRVSGPYPHPNALALFLSRSFAFAAAWWMFDRRSRWHLAPLCALIGAALLASFSRGALAAAALAVLALLWQASRSQRIAAAVALGVTALALVSLAGGRMLDAFDGGSGSLRVDIWSSTARMIRDRPVTGYGPDQFLYAYNPRYVAPTSWGERFTSHPHNLLLDFWVRLGIIGGASAIIATAFCLRSALGIARGGARAGPLPAAAALGLLAAIAHGMVDNAYFLLDLAMSAWLLACLAYSEPPAAATEGTHSLARTRRGWSRLHRVASLR
jgi:O-antigen ligase